MIKVRTQSVRGVLADMLMVPVMYLVQGTIFESPQRTHRWNNYRLSADETSQLNPAAMVTVSADITAPQRWLWKIPLFHLPVFGGWKNFVVLGPVQSCAKWHIGWQPGDSPAGISMIPLSGSVRMMIGPDPVQFFGINAAGEQIELMIRGEGKVGKAGQFAKIPLL